MVCIYVFMYYIYMHLRNNVYHLYHKFPTIPPSRPCQIGAWKIHFHPNPDIFQAFVLKSGGGYVSRYIYIYLGRNPISRIFETKRGQSMWPQVLVDAGQESKCFNTVIGRAILAETARRSWEAGRDLAVAIE